MRVTSKGVLAEAIQLLWHPCQELSQVVERLIDARGDAYGICVDAPSGAPVDHAAQSECEHPQGGGQWIEDRGSRIEDGSDRLVA